MRYTEVTLLISPIEPYRDLLVDALGNEGPYDSFVETPDGLKAYVPTNLYDPTWLSDTIGRLQAFSPFSCQCSATELPDKNWNEAWERQHQPVLVASDGGTRIWVRAPFHPLRDDVDYQVEIEPKMSFGTAHHPTTRMMLAFLAEMPLQHRRVLDMGCGTAILAILASMRGASQVEAIDVDEWAYRNAQENIARNGCDNIHCQMGDAASLAGIAPFDIIIANINRNILLADMEAYCSALNAGGTLLMSGFYTADIPAIAARAAAFGMALSARQEQEGWAAIQLNNNQ